MAAEEGETGNSGEDTTQQESVEELIEEGKRLLSEEQYAEAAETLADCLSEIVDSESGVSSKSRSLAPLYYSYGKALLRLSQQQRSALFGGLGSDQQESPDTETSEDGNQETIEPAMDESSNHEDEKKAAEQSEEEDSELDDAQLAWHSLESARQLLETGQHSDAATDSSSSSSSAVTADHPTNSAEEWKLLGDIYELLGECGLDSRDPENIADSLRCFERSIEIHVEHSEAQDKRLLGFLHYMACVAAEYCGQAQVYESHLNEAFDMVCERLTELVNASDCGLNVNSECDARELIEFCNTAESAMNDGSAEKEELTELRACLSELIEKAETTEVTSESDPILDQLKAALSEGGLKALVGAEFAGMQGGNVDPIDGSAFDIPAPVEGAAQSSDAEIRDLGCFGRGKKRKIGEMAETDEIDASDPGGSSLLKRQKT